MEGSKVDMSENGRGETSDAETEEEHKRYNKDGRMRRECQE